MITLDIRLQGATNTATTFVSTCTTAPPPPPTGEALTTT